MDLQKLVDTFVGFATGLVPDEVEVPMTSLGEELRERVAELQSEADALTEENTEIVGRNFVLLEKNTELKRTIEDLEKRDLEYINTELQHTANDLRTDGLQAQEADWKSVKNK